MAARLYRKTTAEGPQQIRRPFDSDLSAQQRPDQASLLGQETEPGAAVGSQPQVGVSQVSFVNPNLLISDDDRCFFLFPAGEGEVVGGVEAGGLVRLEDER